MFAETEHDLVVEIPLVVRIRPIGVEPALAIVIALEFKHVRVAVGIGYVHYPFQATAPRILSGLNFIRDRNHLEKCTKYVYFLSNFTITLPQTLVGDTPDRKVLDSAAGNQKKTKDRPHIRLIPFIIFIQKRRVHKCTRR
ncbi:MAG: hypothetical protein Q7R67_01070 [bacterium]|nr:hypothetical protein [bacterium]